MNNKKIKKINKWASIILMIATAVSSVVFDFGTNINIANAATYNFAQ